MQTNLGYLDETLGRQHPGSGLCKVASHQGRMHLMRSIILSIINVYRE